MSARAIVNGLIASAVLWVIILGAAFGIARAAEAPAPAALQARVDETGAWLAATLHAEVPDVPVIISTDLRTGWAGEFDLGARSGPPSIRIRPSYAAAFMSATPHVNGPSIVIHEKLHRAATAACWFPSPGGVNVEEGVVQAVAADVMPAWGWRFWHVRGLRPYVMYPADVAAIRAWSARYTGSPTWRTPRAATARRALWGASCQGRAAMLGAVGT